MINVVNKNIQKFILTLLWLFLPLVNSICLADDQAAKVFQFGTKENIELRFVKIPAGTTVMGDIKGQEDEKPRVTVSLSEFYMQDTEITVRAFQEYVESAKISIKSGCQLYQNGWRFNEAASWQDPGYKQGPDHPVVCISWDDATKFADWLSNQLSQTFRLPTEAEWEHAARAGSQDRYYWGKDPRGLCEHANASDNQTLKRFPTFKSNDCDDGYLETAPVKRFKANPYGLYDIYGNVWEWVQDCWIANYNNLPLDGTGQNKWRLLSSRVPWWWMGG